MHLMIRRANRMSIEFDAAATAWATLFSQVPITARSNNIFGMIGVRFLPGTIGCSAKVLCIASDPGATERIVGRTLVGDAGQRVQDFWPSWASLVPTFV